MHSMKFYYLLKPLILTTTLVYAETYSATFTWYGEGDERGSPNCNSVSDACGFYTFPGFSAAVSENLYGVGPGKGAGPYCGRCLKLNAVTDKDGKVRTGLGSDVVVMVNNLCPATNNALCSQPSLSSTNAHNSTITVNLCNDSGARAAVFGNSGVGLALGSAEEVDCQTWMGTVKRDGGSGSNGGSGTGTSPEGVIGTTVPNGLGFVSGAKPTTVTRCEWWFAFFVMLSIGFMYG